MSSEEQARSALSSTALTWSPHPLMMGAGEQGGGQVAGRGRKGAGRKTLSDYVR